MSTTSPPEPTKKQRIAALEAEVRQLRTWIDLIRAERTYPWAQPSVTYPSYVPWVDDFPQGTKIWCGDSSGEGLQA